MSGRPRGAAGLGEGELAEDAAATRIATALAGPNTRIVQTHTGRTNLHAEVDGLFLVDAAAIIVRMSMQMRKEGMRGPNYRRAACGWTTAPRWG